MITLEEMLLRLGLAVILGLIIGFEREVAGKEAGLRTDMMVAAGSAIFTVIGISLPFLIASMPDANPQSAIFGTGGALGVIANIVVGVGFLGAGIIVKHGVHVTGLTTAATMWFVSAIGILCGIGLSAFAVVSTIGVTIILEFLRRTNINASRLGQKNGDSEGNS